MRFLIAALIFTCASCTPPRNPGGGGVAAELVAEVDRINLPVASTDVSEDDGEGAVQSELAFLAISPGLKSVPSMKEGVSASIIGPPERPVAMIFYVNSLMNTYYVPFPGIKKVDRTRRLTKVADRLYEIESNRSGKGVQVTGPLP